MTATNQELGNLIEAPTLEELSHKVSRRILQRTHGAYWAEAAPPNGLFFGARRSYYVHLPERTHKYVTGYYRILRKLVKNSDGSLTIMVPSLSELHSAFDHAEMQNDRATYTAVVKTFGPLVARVHTVGNQMGPFQKAYTHFFQRGKPLPENGPIQQKYIDYMFALGVIKGDAGNGYVLSEKGSGLVEHYRKVCAQHGIDFDVGDATPFVAACLQDPEYLSRDLHIGSPKTYFNLIHTMFVHQLAACHVKAKHIGLNIKNLVVMYRNRGLGRPKTIDLDGRLGHLIEVRLVKEADANDGQFALRDEWFDLGRAGFREAFTQYLPSA